MMKSNSASSVRLEDAPYIKHFYACTHLSYQIHISKSKENLYIVNTQKGILSLQRKVSGVPWLYVEHAERKTGYCYVCN